MHGHFSKVTPPREAVASIDDRCVLLLARKLELPSAAFALLTGIRAIELGR